MKKTIRISQLTLPLKHSAEEVYQKALKELAIKESEIVGFQIVKQSVDARKKNDLKYSYVADVVVDCKKTMRLRSKKAQFVTPVIYAPEVSGQRPIQSRIVVVGSGPAGLFCAYELARHGFAPLLLERGKCVAERQSDVEHFWNTGELNTESNVQFGEGGAGTFSDGKLNTLVKDKVGRNRYVLETFVRFGAPEDITYVNKPHIGTDILRSVVANMRQEILRLGGEVRFSSRMTDLEIKNDRIVGIQINDSEWIAADAVVLAIGHSARDTFQMLYARSIPMEAKSFAVGMRVEHPQSMIDENQYGVQADMEHLPVAAYKLTHQSSQGRGVYSFCMCPGGYVVNASSEQGRLAVNGMSYRDRGSANANSAIIVSVTPEDFPNPSHPLSGLVFQRKLEEAAFRLGEGKIPQQLFGDFESNQISKGYGSFESCHKGQQQFANLRTLFDDKINEAFIEGMHAFSGKIRQFDRADSILSGVESRTSSPVRIHRDADFQSTVQGLYPCGEGAGYAGGITSAAMDGLKVAEAIMKEFQPKRQEV